MALYDYLTTEKTGRAGQSVTFLNKELQTYLSGPVASKRQGGPYDGWRG